MERGILEAAPSDAGSLSGAGDFERLAIRRLAWIGGLAASIAVIGGLLALLRQPNVGVRAGTERPLVVVPIWAVLSLAMLLVARSERLSPARRLDAGLVYLVVSCFLAGLFRHWLPYVESDVVRGVSPVAIAVLFFAVVVPVPPVKMAIAATLAALMDVLALVIANTTMHQPAPPWNLWVWLFAPNAFVVVIAVITSRLLHRLAETVRRAREMGSYRLIDKLGSGGMGEVWRAEHRSLARPAAIKLVRPELIGARDSTETQRMLTRFEREAKATAALTSPHTIAVYDYGRAADGSFYYVMELLEGSDLEAIVVRHGRLPVARAVRVLLQICNSLADAHEHGVVHRDIKPANVMLCRQGADKDFVKVLDFGLVKFEETQGEDATKLTDEGLALGTPAYMAPEVAYGKEATARADVYALGCVAYWLLAGRMVFADRPLPMQQILAHVQEAPSPLAAHVAEIDPRVDALVMACLEKDPEARPAHAREVEQRLRALQLDGWTRADADAWWAEASEPRDAEPPDAAFAPTLLGDVPPVAPTEPAREAEP
jgi:serine/threonine-protein kinase